MEPLQCVTGVPSEVVCVSQFAERFTSGLEYCRFAEQSRTALLGVTRAQEPSVVGCKGALVTGPPTGACYAPNPGPSEKKQGGSSTRRHEDPRQQPLRAGCVHRDSSAATSGRKKSYELKPTRPLERTVDRAGRPAGAASAQAAEREPLQMVRPSGR